METLKETIVNVARLRHKVKIPSYKSELAEGMDVSSAGRCVIFPQQKIIVPTGLVVAIQAQTSIEIRPRSGMSLNSPLEIPNAPATIDADYRDEVGIIIHNNSLPSYDDWKDGRYIKLFNYLKEKGMENGKLSKEDFIILKDIFGIIYDLEDAKNNKPGIYCIHPGDRVAQIMLRDNSRIKWEAEAFLSEEDEAKMKSEGLTEEEIFEHKEKIRIDYLKLVKSMGTNRGGGFGHTGIK